MVFWVLSPTIPVKTANINENTAMIKGRMVAGVKILLYAQKKKKIVFAPAPVLLFDCSFLFCLWLRQSSETRKIFPV